jgi:hypothetical protein
VIRRSAFGRLAASLAAPALVGAATVQRAASAVTYKAGELHIEALEGWSRALVWNGRAWVGVTPNGLGWRTLLSRFTKEELWQIAVKADGAARWAAEFVK